MRKSGLISIVFAASLPLAVAQAIDVASMPAEKRAELQARGLQEWTPGSGKQSERPGDKPTFMRLGTGQTSGSAPQSPVLLGGGTGTIQYDDGNLTALPTIFGQIYGNRFPSADCGPLPNFDTITLNSFSFYFMEDSLPDTGLFVQPAAALNSMSISAGASQNVGGLMNSGPNFSAPVLNVVNASALGAGANITMFNDTFYLGGWSLNSNTMFPINNEVIGLATNGPTQAGYTAASGTGAVAFSSQPFNAILRANVTTGTDAPLELMKQPDPN